MARGFAATGLAGPPLAGSYNTTRAPKTAQNNLLVTSVTFVLQFRLKQNVLSGSLNNLTIIIRHECQT